MLLRFLLRLRPEPAPTCRPCARHVNRAHPNAISQRGRLQRVRLQLGGVGLVAAAFSGLLANLSIASATSGAPSVSDLPPARMTASTVESPFWRASAAGPPPGDSIDLTALTFAQAEELLQLRSRDLQSARAALLAAQGALFSASRRPNPTLSLGVAPAQRGMYQLRDLDKNIRLDQLVERGNKRTLRAEAADQAVQAAAFDIQDTLRQLRLALAQAYFDLKSSQDRVEIAEANAEAFARSVEAAEKRLKAGDIATSDLVRLRVEAGRSQNELRLARADMEGDRVVLAVILAREHQATDVRAVDPWPRLDAVPLPVQIEQRIAQRADIRAAAARVQSAQAASRLALAQRVRDVGVGVFADQNRPSNNGLTFGVQLSVPLFINNYFAGDILRASAELQAAQIALDRLQANALSEVNRALVAFQSASDRLGRFENQILPDAQRSVDASEFAYRRGAIPLTDLLDARRQFYGAQREYLDARSDYAKAQAALEGSLRSTTAVAETPQ